jgi:hypothetical protein
MVSLTKIVDGSPVIDDMLPGHQVVPCPRCEQTYQFRYSKDEWYKVSAWLRKAELALRESHQIDQHKQDAVQLIWCKEINR